VAIPAVLVLAAAVASSFVLSKEYASTTVILVESEKVPESFVPKVATEREDKRLLTIRQEILSRTRLERILKELEPYPGTESQALSETIEDMRGDISIEVKGNDAFSITYVHNDPRKAMEVANRLATLFIEEVAAQREAQVEGASDFIESQLVEARKELEYKEAALREYKERRMGSLPEQTSANLATLQRLQMEQQSLTVSLRGARERLGSLEKSLGDQLRGTAGSTSNLDPSTELNQLRAQLVALRGRYTDEHPDVKLVLSRIARLEKILADAAAGGGAAPIDPSTAATRSQIEQARIEVRELEAKQADVARQVDTFQARVEQAPRTEQELATLTRDYQKLRENYLMLLNKKMDAQMAERLEKRWKGEQFRILDPAHLPDVHFFPDRMVFFVGGLLGGLVLGLAVALAADFVDHSVKSVREVEATLPYPVLATIPHVGEEPLALAYRRSEGRGAGRKRPA
jgi:polysaccharide chain length determinant protein (PEP-CTERM system associated)